MIRFLIILAFLFLASCTPYNDKTEKKYQENKQIINGFLEELGMEDNPFIELISEGKLDQQRKKYIASLSKEEMKELVKVQVVGVPRIKMGTERTKEYFKEIKNIDDHSVKYQILTEKYPDLMLSENN